MSYAQHLTPRPEVLSEDGIEGIIDLRNLEDRRHRKLESKPEAFLDLTYPTADISELGSRSPQVTIFDLKDMADLHVTVVPKEAPFQQRRVGGHHAVRGCRQCTTSRTASASVVKSGISPDFAGRYVGRRSWRRGFRATAGTRPWLRAGGRWRESGRCGLLSEAR
jgi:hypothetical protein